MSKLDLQSYSDVSYNKIYFEERLVNKIARYLLTVTALLFIAAAVIQRISLI